MVSPTHRRMSDADDAPIVDEPAHVAQAAASAVAVIRALRRLRARRAGGVIGAAEYRGAVTRLVSPSRAAGARASPPGRNR